MTTEPNWTDTTSYQRGEERVPRTWSLKLGPIRLVVMSDHRANPGFWTMHGYGFDIDTFDLKLPSDQPAELAQRMAVTVARNKLSELAKALGRVK